MSKVDEQGKQKRAAATIETSWGAYEEELKQFSKSDIEQ